MPSVRRMGYLLVLLVGAALATATAWKPPPPPPFAGVSGDSVPRRIGGYDGRDYALAPEVKAALSSADTVSRTYARAGGAGAADAVDFVLIGGTDRTALHDPRSCLVGAGWKLEGDRTESLPGAAVAARTCRAVGLPGAPGYDIVYLYVVNGRVINQVTQIRAAMLWSALLGRRNTPVYFLRFMRPLDPDSSGAAARHDQLTEFASQMWGALSPALMKRSTL